MSRLLLRAAGVMLAAGIAQGQGPAGDSARTSTEKDAAEPGDLGALSIEELMQVKVQGAALHPQSLSDAPASVTIITAEDIRKYGYRTLGEALSSVRGFYITNNRTYETIGVRGFNAPGDYSSHVLVMVNGHNMTDNIFDYMLYAGYDFPIDMSLIKQIEIIRGPSSALYGSNGMFATINIVTKSPEEAGPASVATTFDSFGERMGQVTAAAPMGGAKALFSGSVYNNVGETPLYFPQFNTPQTNFGEAINMNTEQGYHVFGNLVWRNWTLTAVFSGHDRLQPVSWGSTIFNDRGTQNDDVRNFIDATYSRDLERGTLTWRTYYDEMHYNGRFDYPLPAGNSPDALVEDNRQRIDGKWVGTEVRYRFGLGPLGTITAGADVKIDLRAAQSDQDVQPVPLQYFYENRLDRNEALYLQDERKFGAHWTLDLGARYDKSHYLPDFFAPRTALLYQPASAWTYKFLYGRSFRDPSPFQLFNSDGLSSLANPAARPERADTYEIDAERRIGKLNLLTAAYAYRLHDFLEGVRSTGGLIRYVNAGSIHAQGVEVELNGRPYPWLEATASYALQKTIDGSDGGWLENSPEHLAKLRFAVPAGGKLELSAGMQYISSLRSLAEATVSPAYVADVTLTSRRLLRDFDFTLGMRNAFNQNYSQPIALNPAVDTMRQPGRSVFIELVPHRAR